jgi:hypothetical protein
VYSRENTIPCQEYVYKDSVSEPAVREELTMKLYNYRANGKNGDDDKIDISPYLKQNTGRESISNRVEFCPNSTT